MTVTISLPAQTEAELRRQAVQSGKEVSTLIREAIEEKLAATGQFSAPQTTADFDKELDEFFASNPEKLPPLPADFSREDIYLDHD
jgi:predicted DNA-binding protein